MSELEKPTRRQDGTLWSFLSRFVPHSLQTSEDLNDSARHTKAEANKIPDHAGLDEVRHRLAAILDADQSAVGAHIRVIGLQALKDKVGDQWPKYRRIIHMTVENVLAKALSRSDRYLRIGDDLYLIAYADTDAENATRRTDTIASALLAQLLGTQNEAAISLQAISGKINISDNGGLSFDPVPEKPQTRSPLELDRPLPVTVNDNEEIGWRETPAVSTSRPSSPKREMELALQRARETAERLSNVKVLLGYAPIWDAKKGLISSYAVLPYRVSGSGYLYEHQALGSIPSDGALLGLDLRCLRQGITDIAKLYSSEQRNLICIPIKYSSLLSKTGIRKILDEAARVPDFLRPYLAAVIVGMPADFRLGTSSSAISMLRQHFRIVVLRAPTLKSRLDDLSRLGMDVISVALPDDGELSASARTEISRWVAQAASYRIPLTVERVPTTAVAAELKMMGVTYMSGSFMGPLMRAPAGIGTYELSDFPLGVR